jgi:PEGA domain-containing protein
VLNSSYTSEELMQARKDCKLETGKTPLQTDEKEKPAPVPAPVVTPAVVTETATAKLQIESTPPGADIEVDGSFVGNTPSDVQVAEGDHTVVVKKSGFKNWERKLKSSAGSSVHLGAELEKVDNP